MLEEGEGKQLATALVEVNKHFPTKVIDPKWLALGNLAYVGGLIYGTRIVAMYMEAKEKADAKTAAMRATVGPGRPAPTPAAPPPPPGTHTATVNNSDGTQGPTAYKVPEGMFDLDALAAAHAQVGTKT